MIEEAYSGQTKGCYKKVLQDAIGIFSKPISNLTDQQRKSILAQLNDIQSMVVEKELITDWFDIDERYTLGAIATNFFEDDIVKKELLEDVFAGAMEYKYMPD